MTGVASATEAAAVVRRLLRAADRGALATIMRPDTDNGGAGGPYASLVLLALGHDAMPLLLLSDLAEHTRNLRAEPRVSLLIDGTAGLADPLTGARASVQGRAVRCDDPALRARYVARHPGAARYAAFADFHLWRVAIDSAHLVAGFGRIQWADAAAMRCCAADAAGALAAAEGDIVEHMNTDHPDALRLYATALLGRQDGRWEMTGIDPEGLDLRLEGQVARLDFDNAVCDPAAARAALVALAARARGTAAGAG